MAGNQRDFTLNKTKNNLLKKNSVAETTYIMCNVKKKRGIMSFKI